jgi:hypothetical protein
MKAKAGLGTGGVPNLRIVEDYAPRNGPSFWFEIHAAIEVGPDDADDIRDALRNKDLQTVSQLVMTRGRFTIDFGDLPKFKQMMDALYFTS